MYWLIVLNVIFLKLVSVSATNWSDVFQPRPLHGLTHQCLNETNTWIQSLELIATVSEECLVNRKCTSSELKVFEDNLYAVQELDAFGSLPAPGLLEIKTLFDGSYQECQRINGVKYETNYCYLVLKPGRNASCTSTSTLSMLPIRMAVCLPKSCDHHDIISIFNQLSPYPFTACQSYCSTNDIKKDAPFWAYSIFLTVMVCVAILATSVDYVRTTAYNLHSNHERNLILKVLLTFSLWTNAELILSVKEQKSGFIKSLDCIRFLSMTWVIFGHSFVYLLMSETLIPVIDIREHFWNHILMNGLVSVDSYFVLSGIVVAYLFFKMKPTKKMIVNPMTWLMFYVHRYFRLTPPVMIFIGFFTVYGSYLQGPFAASEMNFFAAQTPSCKTTWWQNLLYINNFNSGDLTNSCYGPTWYLAVDTQLYLVAPVFLIAFYFSFAMGLGLIVAGCVGSFLTTYIVFDVFNLPADLFGNGNISKFHTVVYEKPWIRCPPYLIGILTGYFLAVHGNRKIKLNWAMTFAGWLIAFSIATFCLFTTFDYDKGSHWSVFSRASFYNFSRLGWAFFISWVVIANHMGWGGPINSFMSHPIWQPFGRLSYCAYIVHWFVLFYYINLGDHPPHFYSVWETFTHTSVPANLMTYLFAFFWSCLFEVPTLKLEKMLIDGLMGARTHSENMKPENRKELNPQGTWDEEAPETENTKV